jgi:hypothetical protein
MAVMNDKKDDNASAPTRIREVRPAGKPEAKEVKPAPAAAAPAASPRAPLADPGAPSGGSAPTQIRGYGGGSSQREGMAAGTSGMGKMDDKMEKQAEGFDPVVGWLVVLEGPGRGKAVSVFAGMNSVGRDEGQRIRLDFGDAGISREGAAFITFEPKRRTFHINHGGKANIVYLNDEAVLTPVPLANGHMIAIGATKLRFVALCGPEFNWEDMK